MSKTANNKQDSDEIRYPISVNIIRFSRYDFDKIKTQEILVFEWLFMNYSHWHFKKGNDEFYKSNKDIFEDIGVKRKIIENSVKKFTEIGFLTYETKKSNVGLTYHHYSINFDILLNNLDQFFKTEYIPTMKDYFIEFIENKGKMIEYNKKPLPLDELVIMYSKNKNLVNRITTKYIIDESQLSKYLNQFSNNLKDQNITVKKEYDFYQHFAHSIKKLIDDDPYKNKKVS